MEQEMDQDIWEPIRLSISEEEYLFLLACMDALPVMEKAEEEIKSTLEKGQALALERGLFRKNEDGEMEVAREILPMLSQMASYDICFHLTGFEDGKEKRNLRLSQRGKIGLMTEEFSVDPSLDIEGNQESGIEKIERESEKDRDRGKHYELTLLPDPEFIIAAMTDCFGETKNQETKNLWEMDADGDWETALEGSLTPQSEERLWIVEAEYPEDPNYDFTTMLFFCKDKEIMVHFTADHIYASQREMKDYLGYCLYWKRMLMGEGSGEREEDDESQDK